MKHGASGRHLRALPGGRDVAGVRIGLWRRPGLPPAVDAVLREEDTALVMSAPVGLDPAPGEHPLRLFTALADFREQPPGRVLVGRGRPSLLRVIVYDFGQEPVSRPAWVRAGLGNALNAVARGAFACVALEPLGVRPALLSAPRFVTLLGEALRASPATTLRRLWLLDPGGDRLSLQVLDHLDAAPP